MKSCHLANDLTSLLQIKPLDLKVFNKKCHPGIITGHCTIFYTQLYNNILYTAQFLSKLLSLAIDLGIRHPKLTSLTVSIVCYYDLLLWDNKMRYILA